MIQINNDLFRIFVFSNFWSMCVATFENHSKNEKFELVEICFLKL
jgi:hypothetical protein